MKHLDQEIRISERIFKIFKGILSIDIKIKNARE